MGLRQRKKGEGHGPAPFESAESLRLLDDLFHSGRERLDYLGPGLEGSHQISGALCPAGDHDTNTLRGMRRGKKPSGSVVHEMQTDSKHGEQVLFAYRPSFHQCGAEPFRRAQQLPIVRCYLQEHGDVKGTKHHGNAASRDAIAEPLLGAFFPHRHRPLEPKALNLGCQNDHGKPIVKGVHAHTRIDVARAR